MRVAVIGAGHWGPNIIRSFMNHPSSVVNIIVEFDKSKWGVLQDKFPEVELRQDYTSIQESEIDCVAIVTPAASHFEILKYFIKLNKHIFVEKPLTKSLDEALSIKEETKSNFSKCLMVGHIYLYNSTIIEAKRLLDLGYLGDIFHITMQRTNLGPVRTDVNVTFDLAAHDISILNYFLQDEPESVSSIEGNWINKGIADASFTTLRYKNNLIVNIQCSWLSPRKTREIIVVGSKKMMIIDELNENTPLVVFDRGIEEDDSKYPYFDNLDQFRKAVKRGAEEVVKIQVHQPLHQEINHFIESAMNRLQPKTDIEFGLKVVRVLEKMVLSAEAYDSKN